MVMDSLSRLFRFGRRSGNGRPGTSSPRKPHHLRVPLTLEMLEDRAVPAAISLTTLGSVGYTQDFNTLATSGAVSWVNGSSGAGGTIDGWDAFTSSTGNPVATYTAGSGTSNTGALYSFGTDTDTDRALGSIGSNTAHNFLYGAKFVNNTGSTIGSVTVTFTGEQWRDAGNNPALLQSLKLHYSTTATALFGSGATDFFEVPDAEFVSPTATTTAGALDGNDAANRQTFTVTISGLNVAAGETFWLRWTDINDSFTDHGLAIDDVSVQADSTGTGDEGLVPASFTSSGYTQNFDSLPLSGVSGFLPYETLEGWTAFVGNTSAPPASITADDGTSNAGGLYSYGSTSSSDRALGSIGSNNDLVGNVSYSLRLSNDSGSTITALDVSYVGEQWRNGGNTAAQQLKFQYSTDGVNFIDVSALNFTTPVTGSTAATLDGNDAANRQTVSGTITGLNIAAGQVFILRWVDTNDSGNDHAVAIDDLSVTASTATAPAGASLTASGYAQNFDSLATSGVSTWADNTTLPGWSVIASNPGAPPTTYTASTGTSTAGALYSFGSTATPADRALGSIGSNNAAAGNFTYTLKLDNNSGDVVSALNVSYVGEQWRNGGNTTAQTLQFQYSTDGVTWISVPALDFTSPVHTATAGALDGNDAANRTAISGSISGLTLAVGESIWLRWVDVNDAGNDHGLAIDDLSITI